MRKQDYLVDLIHSLSANESRYFKLYSSLQAGDKKYLELFEKLEGKTTYNPRLLCKELGVSDSQLAANKHYLQLILLRCLRTYDEQATEISVVNGMKEEARMLMNRRMFDYALEIAEKAKDKAWKLEQFEMIDDLLWIKSLCLLQLLRTDEAQNIPEEYIKVSKILAELMEMNRVKASAFKLDIQRPMGNEVKELEKHPFLKKKPEQLQSIRAKVSWFEVKFRIHLWGNDHVEGRKVSLQEWNLYRQDPMAKVISPITYLVNFTRLANSEFQAANYLRALEIIEELAELLEQKTISAAKVLAQPLSEYCSVFKTHVYLNLLRFEDAVKEAELIIPVIGNRNASERYTILFQLSVALFHLGRTGEAMDRLNELLQTKTEARLDLQQYARPLLMLVHLDTGNFSTVPYLIKSTKEWMRRSKKTNDELDLFFKHVSAIAKSPLSKRQAWNEMRSDVKAGKFESLDAQIKLSHWLKKTQ